MHARMPLLSDSKNKLNKQEQSYKPLITIMMLMPHPCLCFRFLYPGLGIKAADAGLQTFTTTGIFIISGLNLKRGEATQALSAWGSILYGLVTILLITPLAGFVAIRLPLQPPELAFGLAVFCCMPTTLSSAVSLTQVR